MGRQCTTLSENQCHDPSTGSDTLTSSRDSTAALSVTGAVNDTMIGMPAPTSAPSPGLTTVRRTAFGFSVLNDDVTSLRRPLLSTAAASTT